VRVFTPVTSYVCHLRSIKTRVRPALVRYTLGYQNRTGLVLNGKSEFSYHGHIFLDCARTK